MTLPSSDSQIVYTGNGVATNFPFAFIVPTGAMQVSLYNTVTFAEDILDPSVYSVSGYDVPAGGSVTYPLVGSPMAATLKLIITRIVPAIQELDLTNQSNWQPENLEEQLDLIVMMVQQLNTELSLAITQSAATATGDPLTFNDILEAAAGVDAAAAAAAVSQSAAAASAVAAAASQTAAAASAVAAAASASGASTSATAAATSATNAANSATGAATSATNAGNSATAASGSATTASTQATNASNSASAASTSATTASTQATNASNSATAAAGSATTASTQAGNAATSAAAAAASAAAAVTTLASSLQINVEDQVITGGARITTKNLGTLSAAGSNTITPDSGDRPIQKITNDHAGSVLPGSNEGQYTLEIINTTGAGALTTTGWTLKGDSFDTTTTSKFLCSCLVTADIKLMIITKVA